MNCQLRTAWKDAFTGAPIIDHLVVPRRIVIRLGNEVLKITGDHPDGEAADWVNIEDIATEQHKKIPPDSVQSVPHVGDQLPVITLHEHFQEPWEEDTL